MNIVIRLKDVEDPTKYWLKCNGLKNNLGLSIIKNSCEITETD